MLIRALVLASSPRRAREISALLTATGAHSRPLRRRENVWDALRAEPFNVLAVEDESLEGTPESFISQVRSLPDAPEVLVLVSDSGAERRAELQAAQAFAIIDRAASKDEVSNALAGITARLIEKVHIGMLAEQATMESRLSDFASDSPVMKEFLTLVRKVVGSESTLLVLGETGVGKEYLARAMHAESSRSSGPFVPVNCAALSESLMESELFGHVEGAFTGASRGRRGCFEMAHGGTLFLDEIGELPASTQVKLLRALQERKVQPVGSELELEVHVRLIAATNRDLAQEVEEGRFRSDLFYRVSVVQLEVPPLRSRREDIPGLFESNVEDFRISMKREVEAVREDAMALLLDYAWPGNVRELINVAERAVLLAEGTELTPADLPEEIRGARGPIRSFHPGAEVAHASPADWSTALHQQPFKEARRQYLDAFERDYIESMLTKHGGRTGDAAKSSGIHPRSLYEKMRRLGLHKEDFKMR